MAQHGVNRPEDLPSHLQPKTVVPKARKQSESSQSTSKQPTSKNLQPAPGGIGSRSTTPPGLPQHMSFEPRAMHNPAPTANMQARRASPGTAFDFDAGPSFDSPRFGSSLPYPQSSGATFSHGGLQTTSGDGPHLDPALFDGTQPFDHVHDHHGQEYGHGRSSSQGGASDLFTTLTNHDEMGHGGGGQNASSMAAQALGMVGTSGYDEEASLAQFLEN